MKGMAAAALASALGVLAACGGHRPYTADYAANLFLRISVQPGVRAAADVYSVDADCRAQPQGRVALDQPAVEIGLPAGRASLLVIEFAGSGFLGGQRTSMTRNVMFTPRPGLRYEARVDHRDNLSSVTLKEVDPRSGASRDVDIRTRC